jgi:tRNA dimethylallyltransferase
MTRHLALVGPTASGKSAAALAVARQRNDVELVTVDSMQVYRGMDIGTAKPTAAEQAEVPHHLIDVVDPGDDYAVARYQRDARAALRAIEARGHRAILVGGTGLYLASVVDDLDIPGQWPDVRAQLQAEAATTGPEPLHARLAELDPLAASRMEPSNARRVVRALEVTLGSGRPFSSFGPGVNAHPGTTFAIVGVDLDRPELDARIEARYARQLQDGFLDEVRNLSERPMSRTAAQALGYKELLEHVHGSTSLDDAVALAILRTRRFARRQQAWFRRDRRIEWTTPEQAANRLLQRLDDPAD